MRRSGAGRYRTVRVLGNGGAEDPKNEGLTPEMYELYWVLTGNRRYS